jgi:hypothetical protein
VRSTAINPVVLKLQNNRLSVSKSVKVMAIVRSRASLPNAALTGPSMLLPGCWGTACRPRELGGLGIIDLQRAGVAFRVRWEWLRRTAPDSTMAELPSRREKSVAAVFLTPRRSQS